MIRAIHITLPLLMAVFLSPACWAAEETAGTLQFRGGMLVSETATPPPATDTVAPQPGPGAPAASAARSPAAPRSSAATSRRSPRPAAVETAPRSSYADSLSSPSGTGSPAAAWPGEVAYPRDMEVGGAAVKVRSGPGMYYYEVAKLNAPTRLKVLTDEEGWSSIKPPASVQALIKKEDVSRGQGNSALVTSAAGRVYARDPQSDRTWAVIAQLPTGSPVTIVSDQNPYYVIKMPDAARVYIKGEFLKAVGRGAALATGPSSDEPDYKLPEVKPLKVDPAGEEFNKLYAAVQAETQKPLMQRNFTQLQAALTDLAKKAESPAVKDEIAWALQTVLRQLELQQGVRQAEAGRQALDQELTSLERDAQKRALERQQQSVKETGPMAAPNCDFEGILKPIQATMAYRYRLENEQGEWICLLTSEHIDLSRYTGKCIRIWGDKLYRPDLRKNVCSVKRVEEVYSTPATE